MEENLEKVEEVQQEEITQEVNEPVFDSVDDDDVIKINLDKPIEDEPEQAEEVEASSTDDERVVRVDESTESTKNKRKYNRKSKHKKHLL